MLPLKTFKDKTKWENIKGGGDLICSVMWIRKRYNANLVQDPGSALASASMRTPMRIRIQVVKYRRERFAYMNKLDFLFAFSDIS